MTKIASSPPFFYRLAPIFLVISLLVVYLFSLAPDITWAHAGSDGGDLMTAAATGGVAHPTGYPTFLWLARLFQFLPVGTIAYRTNLMSAVFTALTALLVYDIVVASPNSPAKDNRLAGLIAGYAYGLSPLAWSQAVITEVYPLHVFLVVLILWLLVGRFAYSPNKSLLDVVIGLAMGLALGNHLTSAALLPVALLAGIVPPPSSEPKNAYQKDRETRFLAKKPSEQHQGQETGFLFVRSSKEKKGFKRKKDAPAQASINWAALDWASFGRRLGSVLVGLLLVYGSILWRAGTRPPINWGYADNLNQLWWLVSGALYEHLAFSMPSDEMLLRVISVAQLLLTQFWMLGLLVGLYHLFGNFSLSRLSLSLGWVAVTNTIFSLGYASLDSYVYLLPFFCVFAIWIGFGIGNITQRLAQQKTWLNLGVSGLLLASFWGMALLNYPKIDLSGDQRTQKFIKATLATLPSQAIVVTNDRALFSLWYYHFVLKERQDLAVLSRGLLPEAWYIDVLHDTYSTLNIALKDVAITQVNPIPLGLDIDEAKAKEEAEAEARLSNSLGQANPMRSVCNVTVFNEPRSIVEQMSLVCYLPASEKPNTPFLSIIQPIETIDQ
jgi:hypothetical protein